MKYIPIEVVWDKFQSIWPGIELDRSRESTQNTVEEKVQKN